MATTGFIDGVVDGAIKGWIANTDFPDNLEEIVVTGHNEKYEIFHPLVFRYDVCMHLGLMGTFGFSIPLHALSKLGSSVSLKCRNGCPLEGGMNIPLKLPLMDLSERKFKRIFIHIQKCSGTSLRNSIMAHYHPDKVLFVYPEVSNGVSEYSLEQVSSKQLDSFDLFYGHFKFGFGRLLNGPFTYITMLRDPIERLRSQFWHAYRLWKKSSTEDRLRSFIEEQESEEFDNLMTRSIAGVGMHNVPFGCIDESCVETALQNIRKSFSYVGLLENLHNSKHDLSSIFGMKLGDLRRDNLAESRSFLDIRESLSINWPKLIERNSWDILLYSRIIDEGLHSDVRLPGLIV